MRILYRSITTPATGPYLMQRFRLSQTPAFDSQAGPTFLPDCRNISKPRAMTRCIVAGSFCCMAWGVLERPRFVWSLLRRCLTSKHLVVGISCQSWIPSALPMFSGLMHLLLAPLNRDWRVSATSPKLSYMSRMVHRYQLSSGLALWEINMLWFLIMLILWHQRNLRGIFHLGQEEAFW